MNVKETLKNLHQKFPTMSLDDLLIILDCYVSGYNWNGVYYDGNQTGIKLKEYDTTITCNGELNPGKTSAIYSVR